MKNPAASTSFSPSRLGRQSCTASKLRRVARQPAIGPKILTVKD